MVKVGRDDHATNTKVDLVENVVDALPLGHGMKAHAVKLDGRQMASAGSPGGRLGAPRRVRPAGHGHRRCATVEQRWLSDGTV
jgi:hypothetical protein